MSDIFREVDEALQREKAEKLWKSYGPTLLLAAVVLIASTALTTGYRSWTSHKNKVETATLLNAIEGQDIAAAMEKAASDIGGGHKALALMNAASKHAESGEFSKAAALYNDIAKDGSAPGDLRDLATIFHARAILLSSPEGGPDYKSLAARLSAVAENKKSAFQLQARLDAALLYGDGLKDYNAALGFLKGFEGETVSPSLKEKADALQHVYEYELSSTAKPAANSDQ